MKSSSTAIRQGSISWASTSRTGQGGRRAQRDRQMAALAELLRLDRLPAPEELRRNPEFDFGAHLKALQT